MSSRGFFHFLMLVSVQQWRVEIETFSCRYILRYPQSCNFFTKGKTAVVGSVFDFLLIFFCNFKLLLYFVDSWRYWGKPGPKKNCSSSFSFCHWNLNSLTTHNYVKLFSLQAYNSVYKDVICLSDSYFDNSVLPDESDLDFRVLIYTFFRRS